MTGKTEIVNLLISWSNQCSISGYDFVFNSYVEPDTSFRLNFSVGIIKVSGLLSGSPVFE